MPIKCPRCDHSFGSITHVKNHLKRKTPCDGDISIEEASAIIEESRLRKPRNNEEIDKMESMRHELAGVKSKILTLQKNQTNFGTINNVTNSHNSTNFIILNQDAVPFGEEDWTDIPPSVVTNSLNKVDQAPRFLLQFMHTNPRNRNISIKNKTDIMCKVKREKQWETMPTEKALDERLLFICGPLLGRIAQIRNTYIKRGKEIPASLQNQLIKAETYIEKATHSKASAERTQWVELAREIIVELNKDCLLEKIADIPYEDKKMPELLSKEQVYELIQTCFKPYVATKSLKKLSELLAGRVVANPYSALLDNTNLSDLSIENYMDDFCLE